jgi:quercetin dioxygenase-like cupin family protein
MTAALGETTTDDERVRITRWTFPGPGSETGLHHHDLDYIVVPITGGTFPVTADDGTVQAMTQVAGVPYVRPAGATHDVVSDGSAPAVFVEIELKT